ncbi:uncharacterized protein PHACADRAFT_264544, partial [Phanerochaete carnosa HHB-10118-sp]
MDDLSHTYFKGPDFKLMKPFWLSLVLSVYVCLVHLREKKNDEPRAAHGSRNRNVSGSIRRNTGADAASVRDVQLEGVSDFKPIHRLRLCTGSGCHRVAHCNI